MRMFLLAVAATTLLVGTLQWKASGSLVSARLAFDEAAFAAAGTRDLDSTLGGPLTAREIARIRNVARAEVESAFAGLRIRFTDARAFWTVRVMPTVKVPFGRRTMDVAGSAHAFGMLGGAASVNFQMHALNAVTYAPAGATRKDMVDALGRGIGRSAVHELAHLIAGSAGIHSDDEHSYEYTTAQRAWQYYGELKWASAWPLIDRRIGR